MREVGRIETVAPKARALAWVGGELYNVAAGWTRLPLDGSAPERRYTGYGQQFDTAVTAPAGDVVALLAGTGTKGLLLKADGGLIREVNRSSYHAGVYRYPLVLFALPDGRTGVVHCPEEYNRLEIEDAVSGERLSTAVQREPEDVFHSRLAVSASGRYLLSAGWVWHPLDCLHIFDLQAALQRPKVLDHYAENLFDKRGQVHAEINGACFVGEDVVVSSSAEPNDPEDHEDLAPNMLARWSLDQQQFLWRVQLDETAGDILPIGDAVLALHRHPRLYDATTGELQAQWPDLSTGEASSSIVSNKPLSGSARVAVDEQGHRFAVADEDRVVVIRLG